jgi:uncharacterized protein
MTETLLHETFDRSELPPQLQWLHPPQDWRIRDSALTIRPDAETDYWQRTHYGFQPDNGHLLYAEMRGDFVLSTRVHSEPAHQYDQAGLMVRLSPDCWLKTSVEYEPDEPNRLGAVITNSGWSDWSTQDFPDDVHALSLRVRREDGTDKGGTYIVEYALDEELGGNAQWTQIRLARLLEDDGQTPILCGLYACSPKGAGFSASFDYMKLEPLSP